MNITVKLLTKYKLYIDKCYLHCCNIFIYTYKTNKLESIDKQRSKNIKLLVIYQQKNAKNILKHFVLIQKKWGNIN